MERDLWKDGAQLALPPTAPLPTVVLGAVSLRQRRVECAGRAFFDQFECGASGDPSTASDEGSFPGAAAEVGEEAPTSLGESASLAASLLEAAREGDWYRLLGLETVRYRASAEDIRQAYKRVSRAVHPDRSVRWPQVARQQGEEVFQRLQQAMRVLLHPQRRRLYDSTDGVFDDSIPDAEKAWTEEEFYRIFGAAFDRNARWSRQQPVPQLGNADTPADQVRAFYAFWQAFDSWREFPSEDADQLWDDLSMTREERRWHERQARKDQARRRQAERARLRQLVETSYRLDPRVRRIREVERARKAQERAARRRFRQQWLADEERLQSKILHPRQDTMGSVGEDAGHETAISDDEEAVVPAVLSTASDAPTQKCLGRNSSLEPTLANRAPASTIATSSSEQRSLPACRLSAGNARETTQLARTDKRPESLTLPRLERTDPEKHQGASGATAAPEASPLASNGRVDHANAQRNRDAAGTSPKTQWPGTQQAGFTNADPMTPTTSSDSQSSAPNESWSSTEYALLTRALKKYPVGTRDRWERIAELLQHRYSPEVIRAQAQALMRAPHSAASTITPPNAAAWTVTEQRQLEEALRQIGPSHGAARWRLVANHVPTRSAAACAARFAELRTFYTSTGAVSSTTPSTASTARKTSSVAASVSRGC